MSSIQQAGLVHALERHMLHKLPSYLLAHLRRSCTEILALVDEFTTQECANAVDPVMNMLNATHSELSALDHAIAESKMT